MAKHQGYTQHVARTNLGAALILLIEGLEGDEE